MSQLKTKQRFTHLETSELDVLSLLHIQKWAAKEIIEAADLKLLMQLLGTLVIKPCN